MAHTFIPRAWEAEGSGSRGSLVDISEFQASQDYIGETIVS